MFFYKIHVAIVALGQKEEDVDAHGELNGGNSIEVN
jgi:hypothetical protein